MIFFVSLFGTISDYQPVTCAGVTSEVSAKFGPLLFLLYINDMPKCSSILEFHLFADIIQTCFLIILPGRILNLESNINLKFKQR